MAKTVTKKPTAKTTRTKTRVVKTAGASAAGSSLMARRYNLPLSAGALIAELLGTFVLALVIVNYSGNVLIALITLVVLYLVMAPLSGGHFNPAVTAAFWVSKRISGVKAIAYVVAQVLGAMLAVVVASAFLSKEVNPLTGEAAGLFEAAALPTETAELWKVFAIEAVGALILGLAYARAKVADTPPLAAAFAVGAGLMVGLMLLGGTPILNPAVALTVSALEWTTWSLAIYILAPLLGAIVAISGYKWLLKDADPTV